MSELSVWGPGNVAGVSASGLLLSCSALLISSFVSNYHLLSSYLVKLIAFLGPLVVTMFLVLLALFTLSPGLGSVLGVCSTVLDKFRSNADKETQPQLDALEGSEVYRIIFEVPDLECGRHGIGVEEPPVDKYLIYGDQGVRKTDGNCPDEGIAWPNTESGKKSGALCQEKPCCGTENLEGMEVKAKFKAGGEDFNKVVDEEIQDFHNSKSDLPWMTGSEATIDSNNGDNVFIERRQGGLDSTRREKEWNRTLAYKLMEERQDVEGEGMDSLWETYNEEDESDKDSRDKEKEEEEEKEEEGMMEERLCYLQALRLSAGMIGRRLPSPNLNLVRIWKAFRGIGWLHLHYNDNNNNKHAKKGRN